MNVIGKPGTEEIHAEFARRRQRYLRRGYIPSLFCFGLAFLMFLFAFFGTGSSTPWTFAAFSFGLIAVVYNLYTKNKWYRCPVCEAGIMSYSDGENLKPDACHQCCTQLSP